MNNLTENVVVAQLNIYGEYVPVTIDVRGLRTSFKALWHGSVVDADSLAALEAKLKTARRLKRVPWNIPVKIVSGGKLLPALVTGKHATSRKFLVKLEQNRYGEKVATRVQMDSYAGFYNAEAPSEEYTKLRAAQKEAEANMVTFNKLWRVDPSTIAASHVAAVEAEAQTDAPLPEGSDEPEPLSDEDSKAALAQTTEDEEASDL